MAETFGPLGFVDKGAYNAATTYSLFNLVSSNGVNYFWKSVTAGSGKPLPVSPAKETEFWRLLAAPGKDPELAIVNNWLAYRLKGETTWINLYDMNQLYTAANGATAAATAALASATAAGNAKTAAETARTAAQAAQTGAQTAKTSAEAARDDANAKVDSIINMEATAATLPAGSPATVNANVASGIIRLAFGIPQGPQGIQGIQGITGNGIASVSKTASDATSGVDTYTIRFTDNTTYVYYIKNGDKGDKGDAAPDVQLSLTSIVFPGDKDGQIAATSLLVNVIGYVGSTKTTPTVGTISGAPTGMTVTKGAAANNEIPITITITDKATLGGAGQMQGVLKVPVVTPANTVLTINWSKVNTGKTGGVSYPTFTLDENAHAIAHYPDGYDGVQWQIDRFTGHLEVINNG